MPHALRGLLMKILSTPPQILCSWEVLANSSEPVQSVPASTAWVYPLGWFRSPWNSSDFMLERIWVYTRTTGYKMQLDTKSLSGSGKRKMTLMSLFNPFQSRQTQISGDSHRCDRTLPCQSVCPRMVFLSQRPKVIQRSGIRRFTHGRRINSVPDAKHQRIGTMRKWEAHGSTMQSEKTCDLIIGWPIPRLHLIP